MAKERFRLSRIALIGLAMLSCMAPAMGQQLSTGKVTTAAPTYTNNTANALSLDTAGNLRVVSSGGGGGGSVDLTAIKGVTVSNTVPGTLDVTCISGCVGGSGVSQGTATTAAPSYVNATNNPLSLDLSGNLRTSISGALPAGANVIGAVTQSGAWTVAATQSGSWNVGQTGTWNIGTVTAVTGITNALPAGSNTIGNVINVPPTTQADTLLASAILANTTNSTLVKNGAGTLFNVTVYNNTANIAYLKFYNSASAPTCGSGTPVARYMIPGAAAGGAGSNVDIAVGSEFTAGIGYCVTSGIADTDTAAVAASAYIVNVTYK